jgi:hypothetical protein
MRSAKREHRPHPKEQCRGEPSLVAFVDVDDRVTSRVPTSAGRPHPFTSTASSAMRFESRRSYTDRTKPRKGASNLWGSQDQHTPYNRVLSRLGERRVQGAVILVPAWPSRSILNRTLRSEQHSSVTLSRNRLADVCRSRISRIP